MPVTTTTTYTCDRDGVVSAPSTTGLPAGWSTLNCQSVTAPVAPPEGSPAMATMGMPTMISLILCDGCTTQFNTFRQPAKKAA